MTIKRFFFSLIVGFMLVPAVWAQTTNYDEALVPQYDLPDVLMNSDGTCVKTARQWEKVRRKEILNLLSKEEYGFTPTGKIKTSYKLLRENKASLGGLATSQQVLVTFSGEGKEMKALLLAYIPNQRKGKVPVFVSYNYKGNHSICNDEEILYSPYF